MGIKQTWAKWAKDGIRWPLMHDPVDGKPSVTVMFAYLSFIMASVSVACLHFYPNILAATGVTLGFWGSATTFYLLRKITKAKFDVKSQSFELDGEDAKTDPTPTSPTPSPETSNDDTVGS